MSYGKYFPSEIIHSFFLNYYIDICLVPSYYLQELFVLILSHIMWK